MDSIEAREIALSITIRGEIAGMTEDGEMMLHLRPLILEVLRECGIEPLKSANEKPN
ncbi:MAG: hypothetical protein J7493_17150 [Porphyrobacter sp.]|nr:hypothetical protein [Porphyrobacter sp.]